jgi:hypothetical protein
MKPWRPDPAQTRVALQEIVEMYFDDMGLQGSERQAAYARLAEKMQQHDLNAAPVPSLGVVNHGELDEATRYENEGRN